MALALFFSAFGVINFSPPQSFRANFRKWGLPGWLRFVAGVCELCAGIMLAIPEWRSYGMALAAITMLGAILVLIRTPPVRAALQGLE